MEASKSVKILEVCKVSPFSSSSSSSSSTESFSDLRLPLTLFDLTFFTSHPNQRVFFYSLSPLSDPNPNPNPDPDEYDPFIHSILPKLKNSLSMALSYFLPLAGHLTWPHSSPQPFILYKPGDSVSLTVALAPSSHFTLLSSDRISIAKQSHSLAPLFQTSPHDPDSISPSMAIQITSFPNLGFSIGLTMNHAVVDGKTTTMFLKSWAYISKLNLTTTTTTTTTTLPPNLIPSFDRTALKNPSGGFEDLYVKYHPSIFSSVPKSQLKTLGITPTPDDGCDLARFTFELTRADIEKLRGKIGSSLDLEERRYLSSFVVAFAYVSTCWIKAQQVEGNEKFSLAFLVDWRARSKEVGIPGNYFGNGVSNLGAFVRASEVEEEDGLAKVASKISEEIVEMEEKMKKNVAIELIIEECLMKQGREYPVAATIAVAGSPRFGFYENADFGWGNCIKVDMVSLSPGAISFTDNRNQSNGGMEIGIALPCKKMNLFASLFSHGLN